MLQLLPPLPREFEQLVLCYYINPQNRVQMVRIANIEQWLFERAIAPQEGLFFKAPPQATLEVQWHDVGGIKHLDILDCQSLRVNEVNYAELKGRSALPQFDRPLLQYEGAIPILF